MALCKRVVFILLAMRHDRMSADIVMFAFNMKFVSHRVLYIQSADFLVGF